MQELSWRQNILRLFKEIGILSGNVLFPPICVGCGVLVAQTGTICPQCWAKLQFITPPFCPVMGTPHKFSLEGELLSVQALNDPPPFDRARAVLVHDGLARTLVSRLKFGDRTELAPWMAKWMVVAGRELLIEKDFIIPVPLHHIRFFKRGYNQAAELGRNIARQKNIVFYPQALLRHKNTPPQVGLTKIERQKNVANAFEVPDKYRDKLKNKRILLVDDVLTTGSTLRAAAKALKDGGAAKVDVLTFSHRLDFIL
ncbi:ComF family protein [Bartonella sp. HY038]|uniref:ComF family protein n=1 Tax=Bartonella sp. HY038 TaxID=2759660 RepID=UPI0015FA37F9|nr:ComF family protein [Bartonella sp. HY038]